MQPGLIVKLPVASLERSMAFYMALGARRDDTLLDSKAVGLVLRDAIGVILFAHERWRELFRVPIADAQRSVQAILCLAVGQRAGVDVLVSAALAAGGSADLTPARNLPLLYSRSIADPDGHIWEIAWMNPEHYQLSELKSMDA